jgi:hypothetical protein
MIFPKDCFSKLFYGGIKVVKENFNNKVKKFDAWWKGQNEGRPPMWVIGKEASPKWDIIDLKSPKTAEDKYLDVEYNIKRYRNYCATHSFLGEAYENLSLDLGPGSLALYLGSEPIFEWDTVWFSEWMKNISDYGKISFNEENVWFEKHKEILQKAVKLSKGDFLINIPDIIEGIDILSAMRGGENLIYDLMDEPQIVHNSLKKLNCYYKKCYDDLYDIAKTENGESGFTAFCILGSGRTSKVQCDFSAMLSPNDFREFVLPYLNEQCMWIDNAFYHLDGVAAIRHTQAVCEIENLKALQFTGGPGQPDGASEKWYEIYDLVRAANKSIWVNITDGELNDWIKSAQRIVNRYGTHAVYFLFPDMHLEQAEKLLDYAYTHWDK